MRPLGYYVIFDFGKAIAVVEGAAQARLLMPCRGYRRFTTQLAAEEWAAWWNYERGH